MEQWGNPFTRTQASSSKPPNTQKPEQTQGDRQQQRQYPPRSDEAQPKSTGRGKGNSKGYQRQGQMDDDGPPSTDAILASHAKAILRLDMDRRAQQRESTFIVGFCRAKHGVLMDQLNQLPNRWRQSKPEQGLHPQGTLAYAQWFLLQQYFQEEYKRADKGGTLSERDQKTLRDFFSETPDYDHTTDNFDHLNPIKTFRPLFPKRDLPQDEESWWLWTLQTHQAVRNGRRLHESITVNKELLKAVFDTEFRKDRANPDGLTNAIQRQLEQLNLD